MKRDNNINNREFFEVVLSDSGTTSFPIRWTTTFNGKVLTGTARDVREALGDAGEAFILHRAHAPLGVYVLSKSL